MSSFRPATTPGSPRSRTNALIAVRLREHDRHVGDPAVRDVALLSREDVLVAVAHGGRPDRGEVGARMRLGEGNRGQRALLRREHRQVTVALLLRAGEQQRAKREHRRLDRGREPRTAPGQLLGDQRAGEGPHAAPAVLLRNRVRRQTGLGGPLEQARGELVPGIALARDRAQLALGKLVRERLELALLVGQLEGDHSSSTRRRSRLSANADRWRGSGGTGRFPERSSERPVTTLRPIS